MKPRFEPDQEVWMPYKNRALCVDVMEVLWKVDCVEYEIQTLSELGHQAFETYEDTEEKNCLLFTTKEECEKWISDNCA